MADINAIAEQIQGLTLLEASQLVKLLEEKLGVSAAAAAVAAAPAAGGGAAAAAAPVEEKTEFAVVLTAAGANKINVIKAGRNYGWPLMSFGRDYSGPRISEYPIREGFEAPLVTWIPSIAVAGMAVYTGDRFPKWKGNVFVGSMRTGEIPGTGHMERIVFNTKMEEIRRESMLWELRQRIREVRQGPDGLLYLLTDEDDGALLRVEPAP